MLYFFSNHLLGGDCGASWFVFLVGTPTAFALAVLLLILYYPLLKLWDKAGGKYSFEWLLARLLSVHR
ncbi:MAG: hypothetical protein U1C55_00515 [Smithellaceae bacterium]|nr:hypothetical protein [Smithellaceae bacterium]